MPPSRSRGNAPAFGNPRPACYKPAPFAPPKPGPAVPANPIFCAIDRPDLEGALALARAVAPTSAG
jgi:hypothetical protein